MRNKVTLFLAYKGYKKNKVSKLIFVSLVFIIALTIVSFYCLYSYEFQIKNKAINDKNNMVVCSYDGTAPQKYTDEASFENYDVKKNDYIDYKVDINNKEYKIDYQWKDIYSIDLDGQEGYKYYNIIAYEEAFYLEHENDYLKNNYNSSIIMFGNEPKKDDEVLLSSGIIKYWGLSYDDVIGKEIRFSFDANNDTYIVSGIFNQEFEFYFSYRTMYCGTFMVCKDNAHLLKNKEITKGGGYSLYVVEDYDTALALVKNEGFRGSPILSFDKYYGDIIFIMEILTLTYGIVFLFILMANLFIMYNKYVRKNNMYLKMLNIMGVKEKSVCKIIILQACMLILKCFIYAFIISFGISLMLTLLFNDELYSWISIRDANNYYINISSYFIIAFITAVMLGSLSILTTKKLYYKYR